MLPVCFRLAFFSKNIEEISRSLSKAPKHKSKKNITKFCRVKKNLSAFT